MSLKRNVSIYENGNVEGLKNITRIDPLIVRQYIENEQQFDYFLQEFK